MCPEHELEYFYSTNGSLITPIKGNFYIGHEQRSTQKVACLGMDVACDSPSGNTYPLKKNDALEQIHCDLPDHSLCPSVLLLNNFLD